MKKLLTSFFIGVLFLIFAPGSKIYAATNTFDCKWNITSCRSEAEAYSDCADGYEVDSDYCKAITDPDICKDAKGVACISTDSTTTSSPTTTSSSGTWYNQTFQEWYGKVYDTSNPNEIFGERYTAAQVQWIVYSFFGILINTTTGQQSTEAIQCFLTNSGNIEACKDALSDLVKVAGTVSSDLAEQNETDKGETLASLVFASDRPFSGISYVKDGLQKLNPISHVRAESETNVGFGYKALEPIQEIWRATRNVAFSLFVLAAIVIAFMIMFRVKISPQTIISIQSALPKIVVALILVTFSYAIAGFLIDLMYVVIGFLSLFLPSVAGYGESFSAINAFNWLTKGPLGIGVFWSMLLYIIFFVVSAVIFLLINIGTVPLAITGFVAAGILVGAGPIAILLSIILAIILVIIVLVHTFKTLFTLFKALASIFLLTIMAPLQIVAGVVISGMGFGAWLKSILASLSTFVVTGLLLFGSYAFLVRAYDIAFSDIIGSDLATSVLFGSGIASLSEFNISANDSWPPLLGIGGTRAGMGLMFVGISFVLFTLVSKASQIVQGFITGKPFAYGTAIGEFTSGGKIITQPTLGYAGRESLGGLNTIVQNKVPDRGIGKTVRKVVGDLNEQVKVRYQSKAPGEK